MLFKVLDSNTHLEIHDPTSIPFVGCPQDPKAKVFQKTWDLNLLTQEMRDDLLAASSKRFYNRYHPLHALHRPMEFFGASPKKTQATISRVDTHFSYLLDMQAIFCPDLRDRVLLKKMSTNGVVMDLPRGSIDVAGVIEKFYDLIHHGVIWKTIKRLGEKKIEAIISLLPEVNAERSRLVKRRKIASDPIASRTMLHDLIGDVMQTNQEESEEVDIEHDPVAMMAAKIHMYFFIASEKFPEPRNLVSWWWNERYRMLCLAEATATLLASNPGSGGLECDFGSLNDIIT